MSLRKIWHWLVTSRRTRALEEEIARLRQQNFALVSSILGATGVPPLRMFSGKGKNACSSIGKIQPSARVSLAQDRRAPQPLRRLSWHQIGMRAELAEARLLRMRSNVGVVTAPSRPDDA